MGSGATNFQYRKVLNRESANAMKVISNIPRTQYVPGCFQKTLLCCWNMGTCKCCKCNCNCCISRKYLDAKMAADESTYTWVMENRLEYNDAMVVPKGQLVDFLCCNFQVADSAHVQYFDNDMFDYITVENSPTGCSRWCCGTPGDAIVFKTACCLCRTAKCCGIEKHRINVKTGDGKEISEIITTARDNARAKMG
ncbi:unnamed protein product [Ectocarpus sp. 6 AP-2014]